MITFPNCKINLGLRVTGKRPDGFHDLETVFYPVPLKDILEINLSPAGVATAPQFHCSGIPIPGDSANNLCVKAWLLLNRDFPEMPPARMHLHKVIPIGAGLGGGSSDGAHALILINKILGLGLSTPRLLEYALQLGSDCPFFIANKPAMATGRGEQLNDLNLDLAGFYLVLIFPGIHIDTGWAFSQIVPKQATIPLVSIINKPVASWRNELINDFETPVFKAHPQLAEIKDRLYDAGADYAGMTGTGSAIAGLFAQKPAGLPASLAGYFGIFL